MGTILKNDAEPGAEMTQGQCDLIFRLLEDRRVQSVTAAKIIALLLEEPRLSDPGMDTLRKITHPS